MRQTQTAGRQLRSDAPSSRARSVADVPVRRTAEQRPAGDVRGGAQTRRRGCDADATAGERQSHSGPVQTGSDDFRDSGRIVSDGCGPCGAERRVRLYANGNPRGSAVDDHIAEPGADGRPSGYAADAQGSGDVENVLEKSNLSNFLIICYFNDRQANVSAPLPVRPVEPEPVRTVSTRISENPLPGPSGNTVKSVDTKPTVEEQQMEVDEPEPMRPTSPKQLKRDEGASAGPQPPGPNDVIYVVQILNKTSF